MEQFLINTIKYWPNPFNLEEGKSQTSQVFKKTSQFKRRYISNITGCNLVEKYLSPLIKAQLYFGIRRGKIYN